MDELAAIMLGACASPMDGEGDSLSGRPAVQHSAAMLLSAGSVFVGSQSVKNKDTWNVRVVRKHMDMEERAKRVS